MSRCRESGVVQVSDRLIADLTIIAWRIDHVPAAHHPVILQGWIGHVAGRIGEM
jgi:hypothetical protein